MALPGTETKWKSIWVELLGTETRLVKGPKYTTRVIEAGSGDPLILIHGSGGHAETYARNIMNLANHFHVYSIDALYHGFSSKEPWDAENRTLRQAEAVIDLLDAEGHRWAHVEGESMGSFIAFTMGMEFPDRCGKLILNTGAPVNFKRTFKETAGGGDTLRQLSHDAIINLNRDTMRSRLQWLMAQPDRVTDELVELRYQLYSIPEINASMRRFHGVGLDQPLAHHLYEEEECKKFKPEALVYWTANNPGQGCEVGEYFASLIPGAKFVCQDDAGHWPQWEHPEEHDQFLIDFIKGKS